VTEILLWWQVFDSRFEGQQRRKHDVQNRFLPCNWNSYCIGADGAVSHFCLSILIVQYCTSTVVVVNMTTVIFILAVLTVQMLLRLLNRSYNICIIFADGMSFTMLLFSNSFLHILGL